MSATYMLFSVVKGLVFSVFVSTSLTASAQRPEAIKGKVELASFSSNLPLVLIDTEQPVGPQKKVRAKMKVVNHMDEGRRNMASDTSCVYDGYIGIKLRGNSSLSFEQKKYTIETQDAEGNGLKVRLLGMPSESDWVLLAPYNDISMLRDVFAFSLWREMGYWAPRTRLCEVLVDGVYQGVYVFSEKIKRDNDRVDITKMTETDVRGRDVTGGYIVRVDAFDDHDLTFTSKVKGLVDSGGPMGFGGFDPWPGMQPNTTVTWTICYPKKKKTQPEQKAYIQNFVDSMEFSFQHHDPSNPKTGYAKWIDIPSFVDYFIHTELSLNADGFKRSAYFYKDRDLDDGSVSKMKAGPVWDYNLAYGNCNFCNANNTEAWVYDGCSTNPTPEFWSILAHDRAFMKKVCRRYAELRRTVISLDSIDAFLDEYANLLSEAKDRHFRRYSNLLSDGRSLGGWGWPVMGQNMNPVAFFAAYQVQSYEQEIQALKHWFRQRIAFLDKHWGYEVRPSNSGTGH